MRYQSLPAVLAMVLGAAAHADEPQAAAAETPLEASAPAAAALPASSPTADGVAVDQIGAMCLFAGLPPTDVKYTTLRPVKYGKQTYGSVREVLPVLAREARSMGGDAIIQYTGSQRFGFFPWRMVRPVVRGTAIKWPEGKVPDCAAIGGTTVAAVIASDKPPAQ